MKTDPISVIGPLIATIPVFLLALSFAINRQIESFRLNVIIGAVLVVLGTVLLYR
jgi:drug/metabolite transporter (DMT)-like permease